jgi:hypothetical protein
LIIAKSEALNSKFGLELIEAFLGVALGGNLEYTISTINQKEILIIWR